MRYRSFSRIFSLFLFTLLLCNTRSIAQLGQLPNGTQPVDTSLKKTNTGDWQNETARISYRYFKSDIVYAPDSEIHSFHRRAFTQPWYRDLGNSGLAARNLMFTPEYRIGPGFGYHVFDVYRYNADSLRYFNTNKPYTEFIYQLGSKLEQLAGISHTQNIRPNWNFAVEYHKINSPGFYAIQRSNNDNGALSTHYQSKNLHYELYGALVYNREQQDENGGILYDSTMTDGQHNDRKTVPVRFNSGSFNSGSTVPRSSVTNTLRDFGLVINHGYTLGRTDTIYNKDSTSFHLKLTPRFSVTHRLEINSQKYQYKDLTPDSLRYTAFFQHGFQSIDSVYTRQKWLDVDNRVMLNGFIGKAEKQLRFSAGAGARSDKFVSEFLADTNQKRAVRDNIFSNYFMGSLQKEALQPGQWFYNAELISYLTGDAAGSSVLHATLGKDLGKRWGMLSAGFKQELGVAPYNYTAHYNQFDTITASFNKESITQIYGAVQSARLELSVGLRNYLIGNYIYLNDKQLPDQFAGSFNLAQVWLQKTFRLRSFVLDNNMVYQQVDESAPVNVPMLMGRHQLSFEDYIFHHALKVSTGIEVRYHTPYKAAGYSPFFARFYYQNTYQVTNVPEMAIFFNFKVRNFRAYIMGDQFQQIFSHSIQTGPGYYAQDFMIRFGFNWVLIN